MEEAKFDLKAVVRKNIWELAPYTCARDEFEGGAEVMLDANENAFGPCGQGAKAKGLERYPDTKLTEIKEGLCKLRGGVLSSENVFLGVGSDEAIDLVMRIFCKPGQDKILTCPPTYGMYAVSAATNDVAVTTVPLLPETFQLDTGSITKAIRSDPSIKVIFVCNPNNPTGNSVKAEAIRELARGFSGIVVVDEAYIDFSAEGSWANEVLRVPNLVVMQTFSKSFGLAGARIGMAYASSAIIAVMNKVKAPYNVSGVTASIARHALSHNAGDMRSKVSLILTERKRLEAELPALPIVIKVYPSDSNFLLVKVHGAKKVYDTLASSGVVVRNRSTQPLCSGCLRITVGTPAENTTLLSLLSAMQPSKL